MKLFYAVMIGAMGLAGVPGAVEGNNVPYPKENVAEFVVAKLDVTTLPSAVRPKRENGKKTFAEYGYVTRQIADKEAIIERAAGDSEINIRILEQRSSGLYVCTGGESKNAGRSRMQGVFLLTMKSATGLLRGRESFVEFEGCPVIGGADADADASY
jgi:hypothetical protein